MTNAEAKQEAIKAAWIGVVGLFNFDKLSFDENGWSNFHCKKLIPQHSWDRLLDSKVKHAKSNLESDKIVYRPKDLKGLEINNGWTRIEPDGSNLPKEAGKYLFLTNDGVMCELWCQEGTGMMLCSHWRPIVEIPKPLY